MLISFYDDYLSNNFNICHFGITSLVFFIQFETLVLGMSVFFFFLIKTWAFGVLGLNLDLIQTSETALLGERSAIFLLPGGVEIQVSQASIGLH